MRLRSMYGSPLVNVQYRIMEYAHRRAAGDARAKWRYVAACEMVWFGALSTLPLVANSVGGAVSATYRGDAYAFRDAGTRAGCYVASGLLGALVLTASGLTGTGLGQIALYLSVVTCECALGDVIARAPVSPTSMRDGAIGSVLVMLACLLLVAVVACVMVCAEGRYARSRSGMIVCVHSPNETVTPPILAADHVGTSRV